MNRIAQAKTTGKAVLDRVRRLSQERHGAATPDHVDALLERWPAAPAEVAEEMRARYGEPDEATTERLIWHHNRPWTRTTVLRDEIPHHFPAPHTDFLAQSVAYRVPAEHLSDLARFNGSVGADRTVGELTARCDSEAMNILALNLAHELINGERSVEQARETFAEEVAMHAVNPPSAYSVRLLFDPPAADPADYDAPAVGESPQRSDGERMTHLAEAR